MTNFSVWAPNARRVRLLLEDDGTLHEMVAGERGRFEIELPGVAAGARYRFVLDDGTPMPDPRSAFQPAGVHGPSQLVDHDAFRWTDDAWNGIELSGAVIYELHVGTFSAEGTFVSAIEKLDYLVDLGVDAVELMPVVEFPGNHGWGYDGVDLFAPHHIYGGPEGLKQLVDACHVRGLAVMIDVVYNHLGPDGNYLAAYGPYFTDRYSTPWGPAVNFDGRGSDEVRRFVIDNAVMWLRDYHADGLRLDAVHSIFDSSATHILEALQTEVQAFDAESGRSKLVIAESDLNDPRETNSTQRGGYGLDAQWSDNFHHAVHALLTGEHSGYYADFDGVELVVQALERSFVYVGQYAPSRDRAHGRDPGETAAFRFVHCLQNHDQVGNRAFGERSAALMSSDRSKVAAALLLLAPYTALIFAGEEWAASSPFQYFTDHGDPDLAAAVTAGRRREFEQFGWSDEQIPDPQAISTFDRSKLNWDEVANRHHGEVLAWYRSLISLRRQIGGEPAKVSAEGALVRMSRGSYEVVANLGAQPVELGPPAGSIVAASPAAPLLEDGTMRLPSDGVVVIGPG